MLISGRPNRKRPIVFFAGMIAAIVAAIDVAGGEPEPPPSLRRMMATRDAIRTGIIHWAAEQYRPDGNVLHREFESRVVRDQVAALQLNPEVYQQQKFTDAAGNAYHFSAQNMLLSEPGRLWLYRHEKLGAQIREDAELPVDRDISDPRAFGLSAAANTGSVNCSILGTGLDERFRPARFETGREGDRHTVTAYYPSHTSTFWLDPDRGWNPSRTVVKNKDGDILWDIRSELREYDGFWFPVTVEMYYGPAENNDLRERIRIESAEFNKPNHPAQLFPGDIGIDSGMSVERMDRGNNLLESGVWNGQEVVSREAFAESLRNKTAFFGPRYVALVQRQVATARNLNADPESGSDAAPEARLPVKSVSQRLSAWEQYTVDFIIRYGLDEGQRNSAVRILADAQGQAHRYLARHADDLADAESRLEALKGSDEAGRAKLRARLENLLQPIDKIFEQQLKPRLNKLPTRRQRADAGE